MQMQIEVEIDDELYSEAYAVAARRGITFDALLEEALRAILDEPDSKSIQQK